MARAVSAIEFEPWPKIARLNRDIVITEKIDGTNAAVLIVKHESDYRFHAEDGSIWRMDPKAAPFLIATIADADGNQFLVFAQSRTRFITPTQDNYGFAKWVDANAETLVQDLGEGRHFGEWWGQGIQRGYGLKQKLFSLFNTSRWRTPEEFLTPQLRVVPVLYWGPQSEQAVENTLEVLRLGSVAAELETNVPVGAEGIIIWHTAGRTFSKVTLKGDEAPKGPEGHAKDEERS